MPDPVSKPNSPRNGQNKNFNQLLSGYETLHIPAPVWNIADYNNGDLAVFQDERGNTFIPGCYLRNHLQIHISYGFNKTDINLGNNKVLDPRIQKLNAFAHVFHEVTDRTKFPTVESAQAYIRQKAHCDVSGDDAAAIRDDNAVKREEVLAKIFHRQIHDVFGDYNGEVSKIAQERQAEMMALMKKVQEHKKMTPEETKALFGKLAELSKREAALEHHDQQGAEDFAHIGIGPGMMQPVCRHYAGIMSGMLDNAGVPNYMMTCNKGTHITVISLDTGNRFETTVKEPEQNYQLTLNVRDPNELREQKREFFYVNHAGHINSISTGGRASQADSLEEEAYRMKLLYDQKEAGGGGAAFGDKIAKMHEDGHKPDSLPALEDFRAMPKGTRPQLGADIEKMIHTIRTKEEEFEKGFKQPPAPNLLRQQKRPGVDFMPSP